MMSLKRRAYTAGQEPPKVPSALGANSMNGKRLIRSNGSIGEMESNSNTGMPNTTVGQLPIEIDIDPLLKDIVFSENLEQKKLVMRLYRDMYYNDPVCGSAADLYSVLPFSDFSLGGVSDPKAMDVFMEACERLNTRTLMPSVALDHLVTGQFIGSLLYNEKTKTFADIMPHAADNAKIDEVPLFGQDPVITVAIPDYVKSMLSNTESTRAQMLREMLGDAIIEKLSSPSLELDPMSTIYIPRRTFSTGTGVSWFRRVLPIWLIEKNLYRGTLVESSRRQRGILHLSLGEGDDWIPTVEDMNFMTDLFRNADADPLGAIITTRTGVQADEVRQGGDFWKITDIWDNTSQFKMRAMGISESFLSGDANYANADNSMSVFIDSMRAYRDDITRKFFYNRLFPTISLVNGFSVNRKGKLIRRDDLLSDNNAKNLQTLADGSKLLIPTVHWAKQLKPEGDSTYLDMLGTLTEKGVPIPLRAFAAAGGFNLDMLLSSQQEELAVSERVFEYQKKFKEMQKKYGMAPAEEGGDGGGDGGMPSLSSSRSSVLAATGRSKPVGLLNRDYGERSEVHQYDHSGKKRHVIDQRAANDRANNKILKAMKEIAKVQKTPLSHKTFTSHLLT